MKHVFKQKKNAAAIGVALSVILFLLSFESHAQDLRNRVFKFEGISGNPFFIGTQAGSPDAFAMSPDGKKMFVVGSGFSAGIFQYSLTTPFEVNSASFDEVSFNTRGQGFSGAVLDLTFSSDGLKMFLSTSGNTSASIIQFNLNTAFDLSSISGDPIALLVADETILPQKIRFSDDGLKLIIAAPNQFVDGVGKDGRLLQYSLATAFDISTASHNTTLSIAAQTQAPGGIAFKNGGLEMYILGGSDILRYTLSTAFDVSTATFDMAIFSLLSEVEFPRDFVISPDGTKMLALTTNGKDILQYNLSSAYDFSTASFNRTTGNPFGVVREVRSPQGITFSGDGTKMFISGTNGNSVSQYSLSSSFDVTSASYDDVSLTLSDANGIAFSPDGTKMFTVGQFSDEVKQHTLTTPYDLSTATLDAVSGNPLPIGSQAPFSQDIAFSNDGTKMFILGVSDNEINQYDLSTAFDVTTASFNNELLGLSSQFTGFTFSADGTKMFLVNSNFNEINQYSLSTAFEITTASFDGMIPLEEAEIERISDIYLSPDGKELLIAQGGNEGVGGSVVQYEIEPIPDPVFTDIGEGFDISTRIYTGPDEEFSVLSQENSPEGMAFNADGTKMFVIGSGDDAVVEYNLSTAYDVSTANHAGVSEEFNVSAQYNFPTDLAFSGDGMKMFVVGFSVGFSNDFVIEYDLSVAFDVSTAVHAGEAEEFQVTSAGEVPYGITFNPAGDQMYITISGFEARIAAYSLSTAFDVSTATLVNELSVKERESAPTGVDFSADGLKMVVSGNNGSALFAYNLSSPFDVSTAVFSETISVLQQESLPSGVVFNPSGTKLFLVGTSGDAIVEYRLSTIRDFVENEDDIVIDIDANDGLGGSTDSSVTYAITGEGDASLFSVNAAGQITFNDAPDFENPLDFGGDNSYVFGIKASTATTQSTQTIIINVQDATPSMIDQEFSVVENGTNGTTFGTVQVEYTDSDLVYAILSGNTNNAFSIDSNSGELMVNASDVLDFESGLVFELSVQVENEGGSTASAAITINITDAPPIIENQSFSIAENSANNLVVGTIAAQDPDMGSITYAIVSGNTDEAFGVDSATGELVVNKSSALDFETISTFALTVQATNENGTTANATIAINLTDIDEIAPTITSLNNVDFDENGTGVAYFIEADEQATFSLGETKDEGLFSLSNGNELRFISTPDFEDPKDADANNSYVLDVIATDGASNTSILELTINVTDIDENVLGLVASDFKRLVFYPNPITDGTLTIDFNEFVVGELKLVDMKGKTIRVIPVEEDITRLDFTEQRKGIYLIHISSDTRKATIRVVKN